ncbi:MAG TPA: acetylxylan esterase [Candidatus Paceibacterota bacterium]|nr:acetylxylan esterase [Candidatus Paceibacterota bacterium]
MNLDPAAPVMVRPLPAGASRSVAIGLAWLALAILPPSPGAAAPRALPPGQAPPARRLEPLKDLDGYFPFSPPASIGEWSRRAEQVRLQMRVALGLWPWPSRTPLHAVVHGRIDRPDYSVEKVYFESVPGFYVTGSLYRPRGPAGPFPAVLSPHGHWTNGRFLDSGRDAVRREIVQGAERFEEGGRSPLQSRCVQLARMGCIVFHYDMIGYADSVQISQAIAHGFKEQRPEMIGIDRWGLFSPQAESHLQSVMGLQTWNSIRALDFLLELPEVDPRRIGVTGASGGGTQTFILGAIDPRPQAIFPAVMVSTAMQGGCTCENCSLLRIDTGNVEFAALFAPKPLGMTAANDWTREMPAKGFIELQQLYKMLGAPDRVKLTPLLHFGHNYNYVSRAAMYSWFNRHLGLNRPEPIVEEDYPRLNREELTVWDAAHPAPKGGPEFERQLLRWLADDAARQLDPARRDPAAAGQWIAPAADVVFGRTLESAGRIEWQPVQSSEWTLESSGGGSLQILEETGLLHNRTHEEALPGIRLEPESGASRTVLWLSQKGKAGLYADAESPSAAARWPAPIRRLLASGCAVVGVDLLYQGEFLTNGVPLERAPKVKNPRAAAAYTHGYNPSLFARRTHDVLSVLQAVRQLQERPVMIVALDESSRWAAAAFAQAGPQIARAALDTRGFRFQKIQSIDDVDLLPGGAKYGDLPGWLALGIQRAPADAARPRLWLAGEPAAAPEWRPLRQSAGGGPVQFFDGPDAQIEAVAVDWILE